MSNKIIIFSVLIPIIIFCAVVVSSTYAGASRGSPRPGNPLDLGYVPGELLVRFAPKPDGIQRSRAEKTQIMSSLGAAAVREDFRIVPGLSRVKLPAGVTVEQAMAQLNKTQGIIYAQPNHVLMLTGQKFPDAGKDPLFDDLWGMHNIEQTVSECDISGKDDADIDAPEAAKLKFARANEKISVSDGAEWIRKQLQVRLPMLDAMILDYYHLTEHLAKAANTCFGQGSEKANLWRKELLGLAWDEGPAAMLVRIHETRRLLRSPTKREELRKLEQYVAKRVDMLDYPTFREVGFDLGSGPTEAFCKTLTARLKGSGMRWDSPNAEGIMALAAMDQSGQWQSYWNLQNALAA